MSLRRLLNRGHNGVKGRFGVRSQRRVLRRVPRQIVEQRGVVVGHVRRLAEADVRVEARRFILWVEVRREVKGFPNGAT